MVVQKKRARQKHIEKMSHLMCRADASGDGRPSRKEFQTILENPTMKLWLSAQDIDVGDSALLFDLLDNGDGELTPNELCSGISRLKGPARSFDIYGALHMITNIGWDIKRIQATLQRQDERMYEIGNNDATKTEL